MENKDTINRADIMRAHIEACRTGDRTVAAYSKEHGLAPSNYYYWQKRLYRTAIKPAFTRLSPVSAHTTTVSITYPNGVYIEFSDGTINASALKELVCFI